MPSANGVYTLPPGYLAVTGTTIQSSQHNPPLEDIAAALTLRVSRDGTAPMTGALQLLPGTVTAPGAVFSTDLTSGFYKTTAGIGLSVGGTQVAEFTSAGIANGARLIGELIPWTRYAPPSALWVFPVGQTLSRTAYPKLWAVAQTEIAAGNFLYNNGDGSTTFGIMDLRGRIPVASDTMGTAGAGRISGNTMSPSGFQIGSTGGIQENSLAWSALPNVTLAVSGSGSGSISGTVTGGPYAYGNGSHISNGTDISYGAAGFATNLPVSGSASVTVTGTTSSINSGVTQTRVGNMQPSLLTNYILFVGGPS